LLLHSNLFDKISAREIVCMHKIFIAVIHLETIFNHVIKQHPWCNSLSFTAILWSVIFFLQIHAKRTNWEMLTSYDGAKATLPSKINGNGRWERKIVSVCISACDKFTFINGYLLHPKKGQITWNVSRNNRLYFLYTNKKWTVNGWKKTIATK
jgi:hypothetical protein